MVLKKISVVINHSHPLGKLLGGIKNRINNIRGELWCMRRAVDNSEAFRLLGVNPKDNFYKKFNKEIKNAWDVVENCPVKMGGAGDLEIIYQLCKHVNARKVIETGVAYGWSSLVFLLSIKERENSFLVSTDLPYSEETAPYIGCVVPKELHEKWKIIKKADRKALPEALKIIPEIDICHYDSDKTYKGRMFAYPLLWKALRKEGVFISDDIGDNLAFAHFAKHIGNKPIVVKSKGKYIGILIKK